MCCILVEVGIAVAETALETVLRVLHACLMVTMRFNRPALEGHVNRNALSRFSRIGPHSSRRYGPHDTAAYAHLRNQPDEFVYSLVVAPKLPMLTQMTISSHLNLRSFHFTHLYCPSHRARKVWIEIQVVGLLYTCMLLLAFVLGCGRPTVPLQVQ